MRKFLKKKFWSQGTPLGYLGSGSRDSQKGALQFCIGPIDTIVVCTISADFFMDKQFFFGICYAKGALIFRGNEWISASGDRGDMSFFIGLSAKEQRGFWLFGRPQSLKKPKKSKGLFFEKTDRL